jgi:circadian clock protein KaiB
MRRFRRGNERAMSRLVMFKFRLYVAGDAHRSAQAVGNLAALCRYTCWMGTISKARMYSGNRSALADGIFMAPTQAPAVPAPRKIVGTLSQTQGVLQALGLETLAA